MGLIIATHGEEILIDDSWLEELLKYKWNVNCGYAKAYIDGGYVKMHRLITNAPLGMLVDHINHNRLDNRLQNLRVCTHAENMGNRIRNKTSTSGYKGVILDKTMSRRKRWQAMMCVDGKPKRLGRFETREEAAEAYNRAALSRYGEFALLNKIERIKP